MNLKIFLIFLSLYNFSFLIYFEIIKANPLFFIILMAIFYHPLILKELNSPLYFSHSISIFSTIALLGPR